MKVDAFGRNLMKKFSRQYSTTNASAPHRWSETQSLVEINAGCQKNINKLLRDTLDWW